MFKKRSDATLIKDLDGFHSIVPYVMPRRTEAEVSSIETFDITNLLKYIEKKNSEKGTNIKMFHAFCTALAKTIYHRPKMNIFIAGRRFWQRKEISLSFVAKKKFHDASEEALMFLYAKPDMNMEKISRIILGDVDEARKEKKNDVGATMDFVGKLPRFVLVILFFVLSRLEYHGIMPKSISKGDPNYSTVLISNLGSIGGGAPYHHLSNYGTCSMMVTIGTIRKVDGRDLVDCNFIFDERIADGFYYLKSLKMMKYIIENPELLDDDISKEFEYNA